MRGVIEEVPIEISNQKELLNLLAQGYGSLSRTLMEYIDNAFDSADDFFDEEKQQYGRDVAIDIFIDRNKNRISITDNCVGMDKDILKRLANKINDSVKKNKKGSWVNGQFGLGAHAFRLFAENLTVVSKERDGAQYSIYIDKNKDSAELFDSAQDVIDISGTKVELGDIEKQQLKSLTVSDLKNDIEIHFEMLLNRNVTIIIKDGVNEVKCEPLDYDEIEGIPIKGNIDSWQSGNTKTTVSTNKAIELNLKITKAPIGRPVYFSGKGRKISNATDLRSFMNYVANYGHRRNIWSNPLITGYVEVKDNLRPVVHRDDFEPQSSKRSAVYAEILKFEDEIFEAIQKELRNKTDEGMKSFGNALTDILSRLAREDSLNLRKIDESGTEPNKAGEATTFNPDEDGATIFSVEGGDGWIEGDGDPIETTGPGTQDVPGNTDPDGKQSGVPTKPKKKGMQIEFMAMDSEERSTYSDGIIYIFTDHPDFKTRAGHTHGGELAQLKITARLANYLAAIISAKYKEQFYQQKKLEPDRDKVLDEQIDFIFRFENAMQGFIDQKLDAIGEIS